MKNLYLDAGNTRTKIAVFQKDEWKLVHIFDHSQSEEFFRWIEQNHSGYNEILVSSVVEPLADVLLATCSAEKLRFFNNRHIPGNRINYESYATMGVDRFLAAAGAWSRNRNACIVIDAGTACTIDYMDQQGVFQGGVIMPGLKSIEDELARSAKALPAVERIIPDEWPPKSTKSALQWGIFGSFMSAVEAHVRRFRSLDHQAEIWLTGGDAGLIKHLLPPEVILDENLIFIGLKQVFEDQNIR